MITMKKRCKPKKNTKKPHTCYPDLRGNMGQWNGCEFWTDVHEEIPASLVTRSDVELCN